MKVRTELNLLLYNKKMDDLKTSNHPENYELLNLIINGNIDSIKKKIEDNEIRLLSLDRLLSKDGIKNAIYHFVISASTIASACINAGLGQTEAYTLSDLYVLKTDNCRTIKEIGNLYEDMCMDFTERMYEIRKETIISLHIRKCIDYIYENLGADLSVKAVSTVIGLNSTYLSRLFRQEIGISLKQFVKEARVDTAKNLLTYSDISYSVISTSLGFSTQSVFIAVFKGITGVTPKVYREMNYMKQK